MSDKTINLPPRAEMLKRLMNVDDDSILRREFYPELLKGAGSRKVAVGVVMLIQRAIYDYTEGMPPAMWTIMTMRVPELIDAICPDEEVGGEAKALFEQVMTK